MSGVFSALVGGLLVTFIRGSHLGINGPTAGLIVIILHAERTLADPGESGFRYVLAVFVCAGVLQVIMGLARLGKFGNFFPAFVIRGMLSAIGVIIFGKQVHVALGSPIPDGTVIDALMAVPESLLTLNPYATLVGALSLAVLVSHPYVRNKLIRFLPAPVWTLAIAVPLGLLLGFGSPQHDVSWLGYTFSVGEGLLLKIPGNLSESILFPDFGKLDEWPFWTSVFAVTLIASIESLLAASAIDKLDPYRRRTDLNRDLIGVGIGTIVSAFIGGLPVITVIIRSSVNITNNAKTRWSNFYHGTLLLIAVGVLTPFMSLIPDAALAAILVFTGYRLASPKLFADAYRKGWEQLAILISTLVATLATNLLMGILIGSAFTLALHWALSGLQLGRFVKILRNANIDVSGESNGKWSVSVRGAVNFFNVMQMAHKLESLPSNAEVVIDFGRAIIVDHTVLEYVYEFADRYGMQGGSCALLGLDIHRASSAHPHALHIFHKPAERLSPRQRDIKRLAIAHDWAFRPGVSWSNDTFKAFGFFKRRPVEYHNNALVGQYANGMEWFVCDLTFDEGSFTATEVHRTTVQILTLPFDTPAFALEREGLFERMLNYATRHDINFPQFKKFSDHFSLTGKDERKIRAFFTPNLIRFFENYSEVYHLESDGERLLVFQKIRLASVTEIERMLTFTEQLTAHIETIEA